MTQNSEPLNWGDVMNNEEKPVEAAQEAAPQGDLIEEAQTIVAEAAEAMEESSELDAEALAAAAAEALSKAKAEAAEWQDKYVRLHAEWDTYRRRTNEQRAAEKQRATEKLVTNLLPVLDDFERTISYAEANGETGLLDGVRAVSNKLIDTLKKDGVEILDPVGQPLNALEHQAVAVVDDPEQFEETVAQVYQKGYKMGSKVLRSAMVTVTTGGPKRPKEEQADEE
ncbi:MAG: nucleotide exchange factor GrpE [Eggerthellales bacterium]|nr:nucleotide exchange factor GrpE [Eggerthellales bacterium]